MDGHKSNAMTEKCSCKDCSERFNCFTSERIFTDPILQGLFEAFIAQGQGKNEAINAVVSELRSRLVVYQNSGYVTTATQTQSYPWNTSGTAYYSPIPNSFPNTTYTITSTSDGMSNVSYTLTNGNKVNYNVNTDSISLYNQATGTGRSNTTY